MRTLICLLGVLAGFYALAANPPSILNNSNHLVQDAVSALTVLGVSSSGNSGPSSTTLAVNQTSSNGNCTSGSIFLDPSVAISQAATIAVPECQINSSLTVTPLVPYQVINQSSAGYQLALDQSNYDALEANGIVYAMAFCGSPSQGDYPPVAFVTVLPNNLGYVPIGSNGCGYAQGIEFSIPATGNGCPSVCSWTPIPGGGAIDVGSASATTEAMSAVLAALKLHHPLWNWADVKSVLRTTASNWSTGYAAFNTTSSGPAYGYGNVSYVGANSYVGTIFLQPPGARLVTTTSQATVTIYPFRTSRRAGEVIYAFKSMPVLPGPGGINEYSFSQISAMVSNFGGSLAYTSKGTNGVQSFTYTPTTTKAPVYFLAFTVDNIANLAASNYSRAEYYSILRANFGGGVSTMQIVDSVLL